MLDAVGADGIGLDALGGGLLGSRGDVAGQMCRGLGSQLPLEHHVPIEMHVGAVIGLLVAAVVGEGADGRRIEVVGIRVRIDEGDIRALAAGNVDADADAVLPGVGDEPPASVCTERAPAPTPIRSSRAVMTSPYRPMCSSSIRPHDRSCSPSRRP